MQPSMRGPSAAESLADKTHIQTLVTAGNAFIDVPPQMKTRKTLLHALQTIISRLSLTLRHLQLLPVVTVPLPHKLTTVFAVQCEYLEPSNGSVLLCRNR